MAVAGVGVYLFVAYLIRFAQSLGAHSARQRPARPRRPPVQRDARGRREGGHEPGRPPDGDRARRGHERPARGAPALCRGARAGARDGAHLHRRERHEGRDRQAAAAPARSWRRTARPIPSGHAAYATAWVAAAVVLTRRLRLVTSGTLVFVALGIAAAVGVTRVYLRAHWWSDVAGGWGLGAGMFALIGAIALVVEHIRHNGDARAADEGSVDLSSTEIVIVLAGALVLACYVALILIPATRCYGRVWEKLRRRRADAVRAGHAARHRRGHRLRDRLDIRHLRADVHAAAPIPRGSRRGLGRGRVGFRPAGRGAGGRPSARRERDRARHGEQRAGRGVRVAGGRARGDGRRGRHRDGRAAGRRCRGGAAAVPARAASRRRARCSAS